MFLPCGIRTKERLATIRHTQQVGRTRPPDKQCDIVSQMPRWMVRNSHVNGRPLQHRRCWLVAGMTWLHARTSITTLGVRDCTRLQRAQRPMQDQHRHVAPEDQPVSEAHGTPFASRIHFVFTSSSVRVHFVFIFHIFHVFHFSCFHFPCFQY